MSDPRKCCLLAICCPPGSAAQRTSLAAWLTAKLAAHFDGSEAGFEDLVASWLDELPWGKTAADFQGDSTGERL